MKNVLWLIIGGVTGLAVAYGASRTARGRAFLADLDDRTSEFSKAVADSYRAREAELRAAISKADDAITDFRR